MEKEQNMKFSVYEIPREIFVVEAPLDLVTHSITEAREQCVQEYYKHPKGCPNFGVNETCPHKNTQLHVTEKYDVLSLRLLILRFHFREYIERKKIIHPDWTNRALANQRHWQSHLRSQLLKYWDTFGQEQYPGCALEMNPEAHGVNVVETLANHGVEISWCVEGENHEFVSLPDYMHHVFLFGEPVLGVGNDAGEIDQI